MLIELIGAALLYLTTKGEMHFGSALFHSISAFCNAGIALHSDCLSNWSDNVSVNMVFISLIILGSTALTPQLSNFGKDVIIILMLPR